MPIYHRTVASSLAYAKTLRREGVGRISFKRVEVEIRPTPSRLRGSIAETIGKLLVLVDMLDLRLEASCSILVSVRYPVLGLF